MKGLMNLKNKDVNLSRRKFLTGMTGVVATGLTVGPLVAAAQYIYPPSSMTKLPDSLEVIRVDEIKIGGAFNFAYNDAAAVIVRPDKDTYHAFYTKCTHLGCTSIWQEEEKIFLCPCHAGKFNINGDVIAGPPPAPFVRLNLTIKDGMIWVQEKEV